jgi:hypothetical protein
VTAAAGYVAAGAFAGIAAGLYLIARAALAEARRALAQLESALDRLQSADLAQYRAFHPADMDAAEAVALPRERVLIDPISGVVRMREAERRDADL